ncbi:class II glutamine amidotransferase [Candidatus Venteria ishoeyi]|uniref:Glutamine amidotransferases class-II n=1 Tax=Candidatus Venteria ishoeyi TaxID=1899563 RepID=A0A1H6FBH4_9GAMM|nr:class II glutamine amidotransferase [Candidatus Venteria ishoeyi]MDM8547340.1 class II glutamine amidotransferase [Candidatus Venteria ishoeyi]SEH06374.1 Glutamine amidotransferases class-II [Candidatus Venteria ishoeyi]
MCELFAMSGRYPATVSDSLAEFAKHGGLTDIHKDGWGIAFYDDYDVQLIRDTTAAGQSIYTPFIQHNQLRSHLVLAHIRRASIGQLALRNTQPFSRELGGRRHVFIHNGDLPDINKQAGNAANCFHAIGNTDSEQAFCQLLGELQNCWQNQKPPLLATRLDIVQHFAARLRDMGSANFIYTDGEYLFAHGHQRSLVLDGPLNAPGLYCLQRQCLSEQDTKQQVILFASVPLNNEPWHALALGEILVAKQGELI